MNDLEKVTCPDPKPYEHLCPECGGGLQYGLIPCPDGIPGCRTIHFGYRCVNCGTLWREATVMEAQ